MEETKMRELFQFEQGCRMVLDSTPGTCFCSAEIKATDTEAAILGLALLAIRLAEELRVPAEQVLAVTAVTIIKIGEQIAPKQE